MLRLFTLKTIFNRKVKLGPITAQDVHAAIPHCRLFKDASMYTKELFKQHLIKNITTFDMTEDEFESVLQKTCMAFFKEIGCPEQYLEKAAQEYAPKILAHLYEIKDKMFGVSKEMHANAYFYYDIERDMRVSKKIEHQGRFEQDKENFFENIVLGKLAHP
ncbi:MAG: hypothetical protein KDJ35_09395 [Alphaproteobacteria bacterium]|nr:hypothetical protein [Alphaproteobacteria bacterium]